MQDPKELLGKMGNCVDLGKFIPQAKYIMEKENIRAYHDELEALRTYLNLHKKENLNVLEKMKKGRLKRKLIKLFSELEVTMQEKLAV